MSQKLLYEIKQKGFYSYDYMNDFEKFKNYLAKKSFIVPELTERLVNGNNERLLRLVLKIRHFMISRCV